MEEEESGRGTGLVAGNGKGFGLKDERYWTQSPHTAYMATSSFIIIHCMFAYMATSSYFNFFNGDQGVKPELAVALISKAIPPYQPFDLRIHKHTIKRIIGRVP